MEKELPEGTTEIIAAEKITTYTDSGSVKIGDEVVAIIAGLAAAEIKGVAGMSGGIVGGIAEFVGKKNPSKGVKVEVGEKEAAVDLFIIVEFGVRIPEVAREVQRNVKKSIETMTGLSVVEINVHVQGVALPQEIKEEDHGRVK